MFSLFNYLRRRTAEAILGGVADAVERLSDGDASGEFVVALPESLARRLALPAGPALDGAGAEEAAPARNGRKAK